MKRFNRYLTTLAQVNRLGKDVTWCFHPGMLSHTLAKWWGDFRLRLTVHEGIDVTYYRREGDERLYQLKSGANVPAFQDGRILHICDDFLGRTIVVESTSHHPDTRLLHVYAHIVPQNGLSRGDVILENAVIAIVCETLKNPLLPPHLHFSCFEIPRSIPSDMLDWELFSKSREISVINPVFL